MAERLIQANPQAAGLVLAGRQKPPTESALLFVETESRDRHADVVFS